MDYTELSKQFLRNMFQMRKVGPHKQINEAARGEAFILQYVGRHDGQVTPGDISNEMNISSARIAAVLNSLENKELITRHIDSTDRRRTIIKLTPAGKERYQGHMQKLLESTAKMLEFLGEADATEYIRISGRLAEMPRNRSTDA